MFSNSIEGLGHKKINKAKQKNNKQTKKTKEKINK